MYRIIKVLNNNAILALDQEKKREIIRRSFTIWRPMTRDIRWRKRPAA